MATMKSVLTDSMHKIEVVEVERPVPGPKDALVRIRACGTCGTDTFFVQTCGTHTTIPTARWSRCRSVMNPPVRSSRSVPRSRS